MVEFCLDLGPLHLRFAFGDAVTEQDEPEGAASGGGTYSTTERVDYTLTDADVIGFRPTRKA